MKTIPFESARVAELLEFASLRLLHEKPRESPWQSRTCQVTPCLLRTIFGNGGQPVILSFYHAPETVILVLFDSTLPLDLEFEERCKEPAAIRCFRDAIDEIYDSCEEYFSDPPGLTPSRIADLREQDPNEECSLWSLVIAGGGTWCSV